MDMNGLTNLSKCNKRGCEDSRTCLVRKTKQKKTCERLGRADGWILLNLRLLMPSRPSVVVARKSDFHPSPFHFVRLVFIPLPSSSLVVSTHNVHCFSLSLPPYAPLT